MSNRFLLSLKWTSVKLSTFVFTISMLSVLSVNAKDLYHDYTERSVSFSVKFGAYMPSIDSEFEKKDGVKRPYELVFENASPVMKMLSTEWQLFKDYGTLSTGFGLGYWSVTGKGQSIEETDETTEMVIMPVSAQLSYRFDKFRNQLPIVPIVKGGLNYYYWNIYNGSGEISKFSNGNEATGGTWGYHYTVGVHLLLDFFDQDMARAFDQSAGVNDSYFVVEYQKSKVDDFGSANSFRLGADILFLGIGLDI
jgi:hypothetical protein